ncbi:MAG TPA: ImcF-related family protein [Bryobacteraceae bacterium]|nr:ImcF-related family protein [Bryobacteraceae bacterium]
MTTLYILIGVALVVLIVLIILFFYLQKKKAKAAAQAGQPAAAPGGDEISVLVQAAEAKLSAAKLEQGGRLGSMPVYVLMGDSGSTKTSVMLHSGLDAELVAGQVYQDGNVVPTRVANFWFSRRSIFAEAGGAMLADPAQWSRFVRKLHPKSSVVGKGTQAPRAAVVCFDCETFTRPGAQEAVVNAARNLRARLGEISQALGINLPVYVLFTKMDRVPFFTEYVRNMSNDEATQVLGVTVPLLTRRSEGVYAEEETARLTGTFERLFRSLADARPEFLSRETDPATLPATYEFPREFRKIRPAVVQFLVDLCRPSQLTVGPLLRGFYFTGVRPVIINETAPVAAAAPQQQAGYGAASGATGIFGAGGRPQMQQQAAPQVVGTRKVPQWVFLSHLFTDILLADRSAMAASGASTKTSFARRVLFLAAAALCLILSIFFTVSFIKNHGLESRVRAAAQDLGTGEIAPNIVAPVDGLRKLEGLRQELQTLIEYKRNGAPLFYRMGLYTGNDLEPEARSIYFQRFHQLLMGQTQTAMLAFLQTLPATPGPEYQPTYEALKGYLITTSHHQYSTRQFLSPVLMTWWKNNRTVDPERTQLAQKQFDFYSDELKEENPFSTLNDAAAIRRARTYLTQFAGAERVYAFMLGEADKNNPPVNFNRQYPGSAQYVLETHEVRGAFSKGGWNFMKDAIQHSDRYFNGEEWVLGPQSAATIDRAKLEQDLRARYNSDFIKEWRLYVKGASVVRYAGLADASQKLLQLSGNQSALLELFALGSTNTAVDDPAAANIFQPVQTVVTPGATDRFILPPNQNYINALVTLQSSLQSIADQGGMPSDAAAAPTLANASQARVTTRQMAQAFRIDSEDHIETQVQKLLEDPIINVEGMLRALGPQELNAKGKALCSQFNAVMAKYPFKPTATVEATLQDVNGLFAKPSGALWAFYDQNLQKLLVKQGSQFAIGPSGGVNPAFVSFFNAATAFSDAIYAGSQDPHFTYTLKPEPSEGIQTVSARLDGQILTSTAGAGAPKPFTWQGGGTHEARGSANFGGGPDITWADFSGMWAVFHFFGDAERWNPVGNAQSLEWMIRVGKDQKPATLPNGKPVTVHFTLDMNGAPPVFQRGYFSRFACVSDVAR